MYYIISDICFEICRSFKAVKYMFLLSFVSKIVGCLLIMKCMRL